MDSQIFNLSVVALDFVDNLAVRREDAQTLARLSEEERLSIQSTIDRVFDYIPMPSEGQTSRYEWMRRQLGREMLGQTFVHYATNEPAVVELQGISFLGSAGESTPNMHVAHKK